MSRIQIYILSKDRPIYLGQALESVLIGSNGLADVIVSDNSETDAIQELITHEFPNVQYLRRSPPLPALEHFRAVIEESCAEFLVLFHDDDLMMPGYAKTMLAALDSNPTVSAVGCNALVMYGDLRTGKSFMGNVAKPVLIHDPAEFLQPYLAFSSTYNPPFPSYTYRRNLLRGLYLDKQHGGKHSDVSFLTKLLRRGPILWLPQPLMWYRLHPSNDSKHESVVDRLSWLRYLFVHHGINRKCASVTDFKFRYWTRWWLQHHPRSRLCLPSSWRERIVLSFLIKTTVKFVFTRPAFWRRLLRRFV